MKKILKKETLMILGIFFMAVNLRTGISSISPLAESIQEIFGISSFKLSLLTSVPVICMGIFAFFSPKLIEKLGYKKSIMTLIFIISFFILMIIELHAARSERSSFCKKERRAKKREWRAEKAPK